MAGRLLDWIQYKLDAMRPQQRPLAGVCEGESAYATYAQVHGAMYRYRGCQIAPRCRVGSGYIPRWRGSIEIKHYSTITPWGMACCSDVSVESRQMSEAEDVMFPPQ